ncbi:MAG: MHS family MFS transporter [Alphaproteobacteria bacterium]|nr:MHS family MFS transporter [Alphaproteobacteria bacterium]
MSATGIAASPLSAAEHSRQLRRAVVAGTVGTIIEAYDFLLYVIVAPLVFAKLYFPSSAPLAGILQAFGIYAVGFIARPVGAALFGHYGDRIGRKVTLISTLLLTGLSTFAVGFIPGYASIGIWGAVILTVVRFIQGIGIGGEWGGATLIAMEWARTNAHRGFITSWPQWGGPAGLFLANLAVLAFSAISGDQFLTWGWRVPFWLSIVMVGIGMYIRLGILETPVFSRLLEQRRVERTPVLEVIKRQPKQIILTALCRMAEQGPFYVYAAFVFVYGTKVSGMSRDFLLTAVLVATIFSAVTTPLAGHISDRIGRKRMYLIGAATTGVFAFIYFTMMNSMVPGLIFLAIVLSFVPHDMMYGPQAALIAECFTPRLRYSGSSLGFHLSSVIAGGPAPLIATALFATFHSGYAVAIYILFCAIVSISATAFLPDRTNRDISQEFDVPEAAPQAASS